MTTHRLGFGPRLVGTPTGRLDAAVMVKPSPRIENGKTLIGEPSPIYSRAVEQHDVLRKRLEYFGVKVEVIDARGDDPSECAAADTAIVFEDGAVIMRPTSLARRAEADRMEAEFSRLDVPLAGHIAAPGLLDGGDVVLAGDTAFVGVGQRGNEFGRDGFAKLAASHGYRVVEVPLPPGVPALRAVAGTVAKDTIVVGSGTVDLALFAGFKTIALERGEELAAGVICLGERHVLAEIRYRTAIPLLRRAGVGVEAIDLYEFTKLGITPSMLVLALKRD
ncbi:MAG: hypothetical protein JO030_05525 [Candidatus Eremiobacteraeota bacterium]|nr:hypothetical protein [Candidatus Eremiobacteraeota bacterium]